MAPASRPSLQMRNLLPFQATPWSASPPSPPLHLQYLSFLIPPFSHPVENDASRMWLHIPLPCPRELVLPQVPSASPLSQYTHLCSGEGPVPRPFSLKPSPVFPDHTAGHLTSKTPCGSSASQHPPPPPLSSLHAQGICHLSTHLPGLALGWRAFTLPHYFPSPKL